MFLTTIVMTMTNVSRLVRKIEKLFSHWRSAHSPAATIRLVQISIREVLLRSLKKLLHWSWRASVSAMAMSSAIRTIPRMTADEQKFGK